MNITQRGQMIVATANGLIQLMLSTIVCISIMIMFSNTVQVPKEQYTHTKKRPEEDHKKNKNKKCQSRSHVCISHNTHNSVKKKKTYGTAGFLVRCGSKNERSKCACFMVVSLFFKRRNNRW